VVACERTLPKIKPRAHCVPWWTPELTELRSTARRWKKRSVQARSSALADEYFFEWQRHQKAYKRAMKKAKKDGWRKFVTLQDRETVWSQVFRLCRDPKAKPPSTVRQLDGTCTTDAQSTAKYLLDQFL